MNTSRLASTLGHLCVTKLSYQAVGSKEIYQVDIGTRPVTPGGDLVHMVSYCCWYTVLLRLYFLLQCIQELNRIARIVSSWFYSDVILKMTSRCLYGIGGDLM